MPQPSVTDDDMNEMMTMTILQRLYQEEETGKSGEGFIMARKWKSGEMASKENWSGEGCELKL